MYKRQVLFPHYTDRITPGWFDKLLPWRKPSVEDMANVVPVSYTHLRAHETVLDLVCRLLLEKKKKEERRDNNETCT